MTLSISIWSDIACPWCFVGKSRLTSALETLAKEHDIQDLKVRWRAYELDPSPREKSDQPYIERIAAKYGVSVDEARSKVAVMANAVVEAGTDCNLDKLIPANTFDAHRLIQWAASLDVNQQLNDAPSRLKDAPSRLKDAFMRGYLGHGLDLSSHAAMLEVVNSVGLDKAEAARVLDSDQFAQAVRADEQQAQQHGISGVPFFVIGRYGISGAQEVSTFVDAIKQIYNESLADTKLEEPKDA